MTEQPASETEFEERTKPVYLLTVPLFTHPPRNQFLAGLLLPLVLLGYVVFLVPRILLVALLLVLRFLRSAAYNSYMKAPPIIDLLIAIPALLVFVVVTLVFYLLNVLLTLNLALSGMGSEDRENYSNAIIGPVIGTQN